LTKQVDYHYSNPILQEAQRFFWNHSST